MNIRLVAVVLLFCISSFAQVPDGCVDRGGTKEFKTIPSSTEHTENDAVLVFISTGSDLVKTSITIDGKLVAITGLKQFSSVNVGAGDHKVCAFNVHWSDRGKTIPAIEQFTLQSGNTYYIEQSFTSVGIMKSSGGDRLHLQMISKDQAEALLHNMKQVELVSKN